MGVGYMYGSEAVRNERGTLRFDDQFLPPDLGAPVLEQLRNVLLSKGYVQRAYIARKKLDISGAFPQYVVLLRLRGRVESKLSELAQEIEKIVPWEMSLVPIRRRNRMLEYTFCNVAYTRVV